MKMNGMDAGINGRIAQTLKGYSLESNGVSTIGKRAERAIGSHDHQPTAIMLTF